MNEFDSAASAPASGIPYPLLRRLADAQAMREMDLRAMEHLRISGLMLMENAARSVVELLEREILRERPRVRIVVCCGKGNNGGDGFAIARQLANRGYRVSVVDSGEARTPDALLNQQIWQHFGESVSYPSPDATRLLEKADVIVDAIFGIGLEREVEGAYREWIETINANRSATRIAVDVPSGVDADDSRILGVAVRCDHTVCFQVGKPGCFQFPGAEYAGRVLIQDISIPPHWSEEASRTWRLTKACIRSLLPSSPRDGHKGSFGHLLSICGSAGMGGAAVLASLAALRNGTGLVTAGVPGVLRDRFLAQAPEIMTLSPPGSLEHWGREHVPFLLEEAVQRDAIVLGCGLGRHPETQEFVRALVDELSNPLVIDADGLNLLDPESISRIEAPTVLTPHPMELSRLTGLGVPEIQSARIATVRKYAQEWGVVLVLKGALTVIGSPEGEVFLNSTGNVGLATAGSGDVLSGVIGGFLAQGLNPLPAALAGVYLHGSAADCLVREGLAPSNLTASELFRGLGLARLRLGG